MTNGRNAAFTAAMACLLSAPLAIGVQPAYADGLSDLRANQELLQQRLDQLAQVQAPGGPGAAVGAGSFPRSFLIPGTDTSLRVGGYGVGRGTWCPRGVPSRRARFARGN